MINIQETRVFYYGDSQSVTVYRDFSDTNKWYIVPTPRFAISKETDRAMFTLREFKTDEGITGNCNFTAELYVGDVERKVVKDNLGENITFGQFDWQSVTTFFTFQVEGEEIVLNAVPAMFAENMVTFNIYLANQAAVNTFKNAFGPEGGTVSPFQIQYEALALSKLPAVNVKVKYDSVIAFDYEKKVDIKKNVWGKETSRKATIKENLKNSDAGSTKIDWNVQKPDEEMQQRVYDWAWVTLEGLVNKAIDDAMRRIGENNADKFSLDQTASFERTYEENQVIEWSITPTSFLRAFSQDEWDKHYSETDNRTFTVSFTMRDDLEANDIQSVQILVKYPSLAQPASHTFIPGSPATWILEADGYYSGGTFDPNYQYRYIVTFAQSTGLTPYTSPWIEDSSAEIVLPAAALGIQGATFRAGNVDFANSIDFVLLDFFFATPEDLPNKNEQVKITENNKEYTITSRTGLPSENEYNYALTYVLKDGAKYLVSPITVFPPQNSDTVEITSPFRSKMYNLQVINPEKAENKIIQVQMTGTYDDYENGLTGLNNQWNFNPRTGQFFSQADPWHLTVVENPNGSVITLNGILILSDGSQRTISGLKNQTGFVNFSSVQENFAVEVDAFQVNWQGGVTQVQFNIFQLIGDPVKPSEIRKAVDEGTTKINIRTMIFRPIFDKDGNPGPVPKQYYTFIRPLGTQATYYYEGTYYHKEKPDSYIPETGGSYQTVVLPKDGELPTPTIHRVVVPAE